MAPRAPPAGVYAPAITLFNEDDSLDLDSQALYYRYLSRTGLSGLVILGTNAETFLLTRPERAALLACARHSVPKDYPIIAGISGHSNAQVLEFLKDAEEAGADYGLLLPPAYFRAATTPRVIEEFFLDIASKSKIPLILYNFPGVCNGVDLDSTVMAGLAHKSENIVGVKLTCGSVGKVTRLAAQFPPERFAVFGGQSDFLIGAMASGAAGCIAAFGNVAPRTISEIYRLWVQGKQQEALALHKKAGLAEAAVKGGIATVKFGASLYSFRQAGIGTELSGNDREQFITSKALPRKPYVGVDGAATESISNGLKEILEIEARMDG
ncbi:hypothetical protein ANO11243_074100 [Dothideomycetidae sp. 11243]|nr:hypothetical protein ANO11243_074100 [fungal sp. No.11243]